MPLFRGQVPVRSVALRVLLFIALAAFYVPAASEHARRVNTSKARGDQTGHLWDAQNVYANWHGRTPPALIGDRNRMPLYAGFLALLYDPSIPDDQFFVLAKRWNIRLSVGLLAILAVLFAWRLPSIVATNLTLIAAFGVFIFRAGYAQAELLFYFLFLVAFVALCGVLDDRRAPVVQSAFAVAGGLFAGLAYLTKASALPLVGIFLVVTVVRELAALTTHVREGNVEAPVRLMRRLVPPALLLAVFLAVLAPYLAANKLAFGRYFYNVHSTFYTWYDDWPQASVGTVLHGDGVGWPAMPERDIPTPMKYWRTHTVAQILARIGGGFRDMVVGSYTTFWYFKYVVLYLAIAIALVAARRRAVLELVRSHSVLSAFLLLYGLVYLVGTAFYEPVAGTGTTRLLLTHVMPLLFVLSAFFSHPLVADTCWSIARVTVTLQHVHLLVATTLGLDIVFTVWPRLMTTYGGF